MKSVDIRWFSRAAEGRSLAHCPRQCAADGTLQSSVREAAPHRPPAGEPYRVFQRCSAEPLRGEPLALAPHPNPPRGGGGDRVAHDIKRFSLVRPDSLPPMGGGVGGGGWLRKRPYALGRMHGDATCRSHDAEAFERGSVARMDGSAHPGSGAASRTLLRSVLSAVHCRGQCAREQPSAGRENGGVALIQEVR